MLSSGGTKRSLKIDASCSTIGLGLTGLSGTSLELLLEECSLKRFCLNSWSSIGAGANTHSKVSLENIVRLLTRQVCLYCQ